MPTENEYKFFLRRDEPSLDMIRRAWSGQSVRGTRADIEQGLLLDERSETTLRVRKFRFCEEGEDTRWVLTFKRRVNGRVIEIEQNLSERDGLDLWGTCHSKLHKTRHFLDHLGLTWEIDMFLDGERVYCVLAELELPEGAERPLDLPPFVTDSLLHVVQQGDGRFSNKKLWNVIHAEELYREYDQDPRL